VAGTPEHAVAADEAVILTIGVLMALGADEWREERARVPAVHYRRQRDAEVIF